MHACIRHQQLYVLVGAWPYFDDVEKGIAFEPTTAHRSSSQNLLAIGDKAGAIKIYNYPCLTKQVCRVIDHLSTMLIFLGGIIGLYHIMI